MAAPKATPTEAVLGQLVVKLGLDPRDFAKGLKLTDKDLKNFAATSKRNFDAVKRASVVAAASIAGMAFAVQKFAASASQIESMSQALGVTTEQFTALKFATTQLGVPMEALQGAFTRLNTAIVTVSKDLTGTNPLSAAFKALGISVTEADGSLRSSVDVFRELSDKFASFEDGAAKSALAMQLFGEQGVKLLPVLNQGSAGLTKFEQQAKELGITLDQKTIDAASEADKEFKKLSDVANSLGIKITEKLLPVIKEITAYLSDPGFQASVLWAVDKLSGLVELLARFNRRTTGNPLDDINRWAAEQDAKTYIEELTDTLGGLQEARRNALEKGLDTSIIEEQISSITEKIVGLSAALRGLQGDNLLEGPEGREGTLEWVAPKTKAPTVDTEAAARAEAEFAAMGEASKRTLNDLISDPTVEATRKFEALTAAVKNGTIGFQDFGDTWKAVTDSNKQAFDDLLTMVGSTLTAVFKDSKAAAIAQAIINTYQGITKALASYPPPIAQAMAALTAAQGFAQVQAIRSTNEKGSGGGARSAGSGGGAGAGAGAGSGAGNGQTGGQMSTLFVQGFNPTELYTGKAVKEIASMLLQYQRDGGTVLLAPN